MQDPTPHEQRAEAAIARIDAALRRIETALAAEPAPAPEAEELKKLRAAHALLRRRVENAIGEIDSLITETPGVAA